MEKLIQILYPELRGVEPRERDRLLTEARKGSFDVIELVGLAIALAFTVVLTRYSVDGMTMGNRIAAILINFLVAIPILVLLGAPFTLRRTKRHLRQLLRDRNLF